MLNETLKTRAKPRFLLPPSLFPRHDLSHPAFRARREQSTIPTCAVPVSLSRDYVPCLGSFAKRAVPAASRPFCYEAHVFIANTFPDGLDQS